jgi:thiol-disulfide isomerase/thioredoxin
MKSKLYSIIIILTVGLVAFALFTGYRSREVIIGTRAPAIQSKNWVNARPLKWRELNGKIVLVDFWDYSCINCIRAVPFLNGLHDKYAEYGLVIIGVHSPQFEFARDPGEVLHNVEKLGIKYPVVTDNDFEIWKAYGNKYWPHKYLIDRNGIMVYDRVGESGHEILESEIRRLILSDNPDADLPGIGDGYVDSNPLPQNNRPLTPELYLGYLRGHLGSTNGFVKNEPGVYRIPETINEGMFYINGEWTASEESLSPAESGNLLENYVTFEYRAAGVNLIADASDKAWAHTPRIYILNDGCYISADEAGNHIRFDSSGASYIEIDHSGPYNIIRHSDYDRHVLKVFNNNPGVQFYAFTFYSRTGDEV